MDRTSSTGLRASQLKKPLELYVGHRILFSRVQGWARRAKALPAHLRRDGLCVEHAGQLRHRIV
jgi:hypothetical protein